MLGSRWWRRRPCEAAPGRQMGMGSIAGLQCRGLVVDGPTPTAVPGTTIYPLLRLPSRLQHSPPPATCPGADSSPLPPADASSCLLSNPTSTTGGLPAPAAGAEGAEARSSSPGALNVLKPPPRARKCAQCSKSEGPQCGQRRQVQTPIQQHLLHPCWSGASCRGCQPRSRRPGPRRQRCPGPPSAPAAGPRAPLPAAALLGC